MPETSRDNANIHPTPPDVVPRTTRQDMTLRTTPPLPEALPTITMEVHGRAAVPLVLCACGAVVRTCTQPDCALTHTLHVVAACGRCTATGGMPVLDEEPTP